MDHRDPPSAKAGLALDLHQAATAIVRTDAPKLKERVAFYIDDTGKVARSSEKAFYRDRAPVVVAGMTDAEGTAIYDALTGRDSVTVRPPLPSPSL